MSLNRIKSKERSRLKQILRALMMIYTMKDDEFREEMKNIPALAKKVASTVWKRSGYKKKSNQELESSMMWV